MCSYRTRRNAVCGGKCREPEAYIPLSSQVQYRYSACTKGSFPCRLRECTPFLLLPLLSSVARAPLFGTDDVAFDATKFP